MSSLSQKLKPYTVYLLYSAISSFGLYTIFSMNMVYQIEAVKLNPLQLVLVGTTLETAAFLGQVPTGVLADMYSRRLSVVAGVFLIGLGFLMEGLFPFFLPVLLAQVLWGIGASFTSGAEEAWVADEIGEQDMGHAFIRGSQFGQAASLVSIPIGTWLATYRLNLPVITGASILVALGFFLLFFMPEQHFRPTPREGRSSWRAMGRIMLEGGKAVRRSRILLLILVILAFGAMASEGFDRLDTAHFLHDYSFPALGHLSYVVWIGLIGMGSTLLVIATTEGLRRFVHINKQRTLTGMLFVLEMLLIAGVAVFAVAGNFYLALGAYWVARTCRGAANPLYTTWITSNSDPKMRATIVSMFGQVDAIGQIAGGPGVGLIGTLVSLRAALLTTCAILSPTAIFFPLALKASKNAPVVAIEPEGEEQQVSV